MNAISKLLVAAGAAAALAAPLAASAQTFHHGHGASWRGPTWRGGWALGLAAP